MLSIKILSIIQLTILIYLNLISSINCVYTLLNSYGKFFSQVFFYFISFYKLSPYLDAKVIENTTASGTGVVGILDQNGFNFTTLIKSNSSTNPLPLAIKIGGYCFGTNIDKTLYRVTGVRSNVKSTVWNGGATYEQSASSRVVSEF